MRACLSLFAMVLFAACAAGTADDHPAGDDVSPGPDARDIDAAHGTPDAHPPIDAPHVTPDAHPPIDAAPPQIDAGPFCNSTADCDPGNCCFDFGQPPGICVPGTDIGGVCLPTG